jgi:hypothetical protein
MRGVGVLAGTACLVFSIGTSSASEWQEITSCGALKGRAYYFAGGAVPKEQSGWQDDGISNGTTSLLSNGKEVDIVYKDTTGNQRSARFHDEATLLAFPGKTTLRVLVVHKGGKSLEQYTFQINGSGQGIVILSQQRDAVISKVSVMIGKCGPR